MGRSFNSKLSIRLRSLNQDVDSTSTGLVFFQFLEKENVSKEMALASGRCRLGGDWLWNYNNVDRDRQFGNNPTRKLGGIR
jgi:hypothetical protein